MTETKIFALKSSLENVSLGFNNLQAPPFNVRDTNMEAGDLVASIERCSTGSSGLNIMIQFALFPVEYINHYGVPSQFWIFFILMDLG